SDRRPVPGAHPRRAVVPGARRAHRDRGLRSDRQPTRSGRAAGAIGHGRENHRVSGFAGDASSDAAPQWFADAIGQAPLIKRLTTADGTTINYRVWGERAWPGVLLVHGAAASAAWWDHIAPQLSGHRVVAVDLSGHGDSSHKSGGYPVGEWAAEVAAVAIAEKLDRPVLVGHSLGGRVAVHAAVAEPELFSRVVLID